jgi:hypothetical protein
MAQGFAYIDAWIVATDSKVFSVRAYIAHDRWRHDINNDHFGDLSTLGVVIEAPVGPWVEGTPLHYVLDWFAQRIIDIESVTKHKRNYSMDAYILAPGATVDIGGGTILGVMNALSVIQKSYSSSFTADAFKALAFSLDAHLRGYAEFSVQAVVV